MTGSTGSTGPTGPLSALFAPLTVPASWIYGLAIGVRNARFDRGWGVVPF